MACFTLSRLAFASISHTGLNATNLVGAVAAAERGHHPLSGLMRRGDARGLHLTSTCNESVARG